MSGGNRGEGPTEETASHSAVRHQDELRPSGRANRIGVRMSETQVGAPRLDGQKVGLLPVTFQSVTTVAPAAGVATALPLAASYAGGALR